MHSVQIQEGKHGDVPVTFVSTRKECKAHKGETLLQFNVAYDDDDSASFV